MLCCMCFHGLWGRSGAGDSFQSYSSQGLIRGDPSQVLACIAGHPRTPSPPTLSLSTFWTGAWWPVSPGSMWEGARIMVMPLGHLSDEEARAGPGGQNPLGCGWNMKVGPRLIGEKTGQFRQLSSPTPKLGGFQKSFRKVWAYVIGKGTRRVVLS